MKSEFISIVRIEQTQQELDLVSSKITTELGTFITRDALGLHKTQLESVQTILSIAVKELTANLGDIKVKDLDVEEVYDSCRHYDEAVIWLQRLWDYLKQKFSQRHEDVEMSRLLKAADEVMWSCYHGVLERSLGKHGPAPLVYIEPEYSPATIQTEKPLPVNLRLESDLEFLDQCLETLPIPVLRLPPSCISSPWWLIFIGHEVGHHVQYALDLIAHFRKGLTAAAESCGFSKETGALTWGNWGEEIFADVFSIMIMGPLALRGMVELETGVAEKMVKRKANYPSPVVRLALMASVVDKLGLPSEPELLGLDLEGIAKSDPTSMKDYEVVPGAVAFVLEPLPDGRQLSELCDFNSNIFEDDGRISGWSGLLASQNDLIFEKEEIQKLETARDIICGSLKAWTQHSKGTEADDPKVRRSERKERRETIRKQTIEALLQSGPRETRTSPPGVTPIEEPGKSLANLLKTAAKRWPKAGGGHVAI